MAMTSYSERDLARVESTGSIVEAVGGIAVVVLAIIGLASTTAGTLTAVALIILGVSLVAESGAVATEFTRLFNTGGGTSITSAEIGGMPAGFAIGGAVLVLGVLALIGVGTASLIPAAIIAAGGLLLISGPAMARMGDVSRQAGGYPDAIQNLMRSAGASSAAFKVLAGISAIVLGILSLTRGGGGAGGVDTFSLVALIVLGASLLFSGSALTGSASRMFSSSSTTTLR